jgi:hypothetical protein
MTALDNQPSSVNFLSPYGFKFWIKRAPATNYMLVKVNIPGISVPAVEEATPFVFLPHTGDHGKFNILTATFQVNEDLRNYLEIHSWLRNIGKMDDFNEFKSLSTVPQYTGLGLTSEVMLTILDSAKNPMMTFTFHDAIPTDLSDLTFDAKLPDIMYLTATVDFRYSTFDYERVV